ncbi:MAG: acyltransferase [Rhodoferax sp.]
MRLVAALMVLFSHQHAVLGRSEPSFFGWNTWGGAGVSIFFVLSGFLVWSSWLRDSRVMPFLVRRALRIFPGLWVVIALSVLVMGPWATAMDVTAYFKHPWTWQYLDNAWLSIVYVLPGVFVGNTMPGIVNGSLWSLPVEFLCYLVLVVVGWLLLRAREQTPLILVLAWWMAVGGASFGPKLLGTVYTTHCEMAALFAAGVLYGQWRSQPFAALEWVLLLAGLLAFSVIGSRGAERASMLLVAMALVHVAANWQGMAWLGDTVGDLSYGVYIYAFPVQQAVVHWISGQQWSWEGALLLSVSITMVFAYVSWHGIEKQALAFKPRAGARL